jgi:hypothetical protein
MPTCCRCWPRPLSNAAATSAGVQPPPSSSTRSAWGAGPACRYSLRPRICLLTWPAGSDARREGCVQRGLLGRRLLGLSARTGRRSYRRRTVPRRSR